MSLEQAINLTDASTTIQRDLKLNLEKYLNSSNFDQTESHLLVLGLAQSVGHEGLASYATEVLQSQGVSPEEITEARECAAIMAMNNIYYRCRHMIREMRGEEQEKKLGPAGLRMNVLGRPVLGKVRFEMLAFGISVLNGCSMCVSSHQEALEKHGVSDEKVHDIIRLAAVIKGVSCLIAPR